MLKTYQYENNISIVRSDNIDTTSISVASTTTTWTPVNVKLDETATITITQTDNSTDSYLVVEEVLVPSGTQGTF